jgi:RimJ/RimL family protein N-acetyltransferase
MSYDIHRLIGEDVKLIDKLLEASPVNERIDWGCEFLGAFNSNPQVLCGIAGVSLKKKLYPQFEHIILHPDYQGGRLLVQLLNKMERYLKELGYEVYVSYIKNTNNPMQVLATKFGMKPYNADDFGVWFYKQIREK